MNGKAEVVLNDAGSYREMLGLLEEARAIAAIREGLDAAERGEMKPAGQVLSEMRARYGLQG